MTLIGLLLRTLLLIIMGMFVSVVIWKTGSNRDSSFDFLIPQQFSMDRDACEAIITGQIDGNLSILETLLSSRKKKNLLSEDYYLNETKNCDTYIEKRGFITMPLSEEERDFPIAFSIVIHEKLEMFERLLRTLYNPQNIYCVHVDQKTPKDFQEAVERIVSCLPSVFIATRLEKVVYASWSRVQADLNCMRDLLHSHIQWKYLLNTCGTDFPIKTNREMVKALKDLNGRNSLESEATVKHKTLRWKYHYAVNNTIIRTRVKKTAPPISSPMFMGNAYFVVSRAFVEHVIKSKEIRPLLEWEKDTYSPDEHLWATLQRMPTVPGSIPMHQKYDTSDMHAIARAVKWSYFTGDERKGAPYGLCTGEHRRGICVYGIGDLGWLLKQHHLLANKFDPIVDDAAIRCMESILRFKALGQYSPIPKQYDLFY